MQVCTQLIVSNIRLFAHPCSLEGLPDDAQVVLGVFREEAGGVAMADRVSLVLSSNYTSITPHLLFLSLFAIPQSSSIMVLAVQLHLLITVNA